MLKARGTGLRGSLAATITVSAARTARWPAGTSTTSRCRTVGRPASRRSGQGDLPSRSLPRSRPQRRPRRRSSPTSARAARTWPAAPLDDLPPCTPSPWSIPATSGGPSSTGRSCPGPARPSRPAPPTTSRRARFFPDVRLNYAETLLRPLPGVDDDRLALTAVHADRLGRAAGAGAELRARCSAPPRRWPTRGSRPASGWSLIAPNTAAHDRRRPRGRRPRGRAVHGHLRHGRRRAARPLRAGRAGRCSCRPTGMRADDRSAGDVLGRPAASLRPSTPGPRRRDRCPRYRACRVQLSRPGAVRAASGEARVWERLPVRPPAVRHVLLRHHRPARSAIVHGAGGTLLEHVKEHRLHVRPAARGHALLPHHDRLDDVELAALRAGRRARTIVALRRAAHRARDALASSSPSTASPSSAPAPPTCSCARTPATRPGASRRPRRACARVLSTGSVLHDWQFDWVADARRARCRCSRSPAAPTSSAASCSATPSLPVHARAGSSAAAWASTSQARRRGRRPASSAGSGSSCAADPFPSRPLGFLGDPTAARFHDAYFAEPPRRLDARRPDRVRRRRVGAHARPLRRRPQRPRRPDRPGRDLPRPARRAARSTEAMAVEQRTRRGRARPGWCCSWSCASGARLDGAPRPRDPARRSRRAGLRRARARAGPRRSPSCRSRTAASAPSGRPATPSTATRSSTRPPFATRPASTPSARPSRPPRPLAASATPGRRAVLGDTPALGEVLVRAANPDDDFPTSRPGQALSLLRRVRLDLGGRARAGVRARPRCGGSPRPWLRRSPAPRACRLRPHGRPVFFVRRLAAEPVRGSSALSTDRPVGCTALRPTRHDIESRAAAVAQVREAQPTRPYSLIGYSFGGLVAFEMALRLRESREEVAYLGLLDVRPPRRRSPAGDRRPPGRPSPSLVTAGHSPAAGQRSAAPRQPLPPCPMRTGLLPRPKRYPTPIARRRSTATSPSTWPRARGERSARRCPRGADGPSTAVLDVPGHHGDIDDDRIGMLSDRHVPTLAARVDETLA